MSDTTNCETIVTFVSSATRTRYFVGFMLLLAGLLLADLYRYRQHRLEVLKNRLTLAADFLEHTLADADDFGALQRVVEQLPRTGMSIYGITDATGKVLARHPFQADAVDRYVNDRQLAEFVAGPELVADLILPGFDHVPRYVHIKKLPQIGFIVYSADTVDSALGSMSQRILMLGLLYVLILVGGIGLLRAQNRLEKSESRLRRIIDTIDDIPIQGYYADGTVLYWNKASETLYGWTADEVVGRNAYDLVVPEDMRADVAAQAEAFAGPGESATSRVWTLKNRAGERVTVKSHYILIDDREPKEIYNLDVHLDPLIEARMRIEQLLEAKNMLLREVHHRIKNNMTTISSLLYLQADAMDDRKAATALLDAQGRITNMMTLYNTLYRSENFLEVSTRTYFSDLLGQIGSTLDPTGRVRIEADIEDRLLDSKRLLPLGMMLNEWLTNMYKYAFPGDKSGSASLRFGFPNEHTMRLEFRDDGPGFPDNVLNDHTGGGFGLLLVHMLAEQLGAELVLENTPGAGFRVTAPIG